MAARRGARIREGTAPAEAVQALKQAATPRSPSGQQGQESASAGLGLVPAHAGPGELAAIQAAHLKRWEAPIKASGFKAE